MCFALLTHNLNESCELGPFPILTRNDDLGHCFLFFLQFVFVPDFGRTVGEEDTVEVVVLVLDDLGQEVTGTTFKPITLFVLGFEGHIG